MDESRWPEITWLGLATGLLCWIGLNAGLAYKSPLNCGPGETFFYSFSVMGMLAPSVIVCLLVSSLGGKTIYERLTIPGWAKVLFWLCWCALFLLYFLSPIFMDPVEPPIPP